jgi:L-asparaginase / beta-aspartyl-peptidase
VQAAGTVNFIAQDRAGHLACAVSTSGWAWKYPGRLGDSPIIGAGNYADDRYGAAACTGWGELALRACTARTIVHALRHGQSVEAAVQLAVADLGDLGVDPAKLLMSVVAADRQGNLCAASTAPGRHFVFRRPGMGAYAREERLHIPVAV